MASSSSPPADVVEALEKLRMEAQSERNKPSSSNSSSSPPADVVEALEKLTMAAQVEESKASSSKTVVLITSDGQEIVVSFAVASVSKTLNRILEDWNDDVEGPIPLSNVNACVLGKILEYCKKHAANWSTLPELLKEWDAEYKKDLLANLDLLRQVLLAAHYLEIDGLLRMLVKGVAELIRGKPPSELRRVFNIEKDFTPEEEEEVRKKHGWACEEEWATKEVQEE